MPNIIACFKWVVDEAYIRRGTSGALDFSAVDHKISDYDRNAIEEAVRLKDALGGKVFGVTVGSPEAAKGVKDALSRGIDEVCFIADSSFKDLEPDRTSVILAEVIRSRINDFAIILCGEGSGDLYAQQVGPRLAEYLNIPCLSFVQNLALEPGRIRAERRTEDGVEVVAAPLPVVVTVLPEINTPRIPSVKDTLMASKKPVTTIGKEDLTSTGASHLETVSLTAARMERTCERFGADAPEIERFVDALRKKGAVA